LLKQDRLSLLEQRLEKIDREETAVLFLGSSRDDSNNERNSVLSEIDTALANYGPLCSLESLRELPLTDNADAMVERNYRMLTYEAAKPRDVLSLQNWVNGNACLAREETAYLTHCKELLSIASSDDGAVTQLKAWVEDNLIRFYKCFREVRICTLHRCKLTTTTGPLQRCLKRLKRIHFLQLLDSADDSNADSIHHHRLPVSPGDYLQLPE
jgi:hypothetical protein